MCAHVQAQALLAVSLNGVASHVARRCVFSVLLSWPSEMRCTSRIIGGADRLLSLAKLVAAGVLASSIPIPPPPMSAHSKAWMVMAQLETLCFTPVAMRSSHTCTHRRGYIQ